jgi:hypothetical protein
MVMLGGKARVGKTTVAKLVAEYSYHHGFLPVFVPFAYGIKKKAEEMGLSKEKDSKQYREYCQQMGARQRMDNPDYWIDIWKEKVTSVIKDEAIDIEKDKKYWERVIIVDDCRYMNEIAAGRDFDAIQIFISHDKRNIDEQDAAWRVHESEMLANNIEAGDPNYKGIFDVILVNDGTIDNLKEVIGIYTELWLGIRVLSREDEEKINTLSQAQMQVQYVSQLLDELLENIGIPTDEEIEEIERELEEEDEDDEEFQEGAD